MLDSSIVWIFLSDDAPDKTRSTLLLSLGVADTDSRICAHRNPLTYSLLQYPCDDRLIGIDALLSLDDRCEDELLVCTCSLCRITHSDLLIELSQEHHDHVVCGSTFEYPIGIWVEKTLQTLDSREPRESSLILTESICSHAKKVSRRYDILLAEVCIDIVHIPSWEDRDRDITMNWCRDRLGEEGVDRTATCSHIFSCLEHDITWCKEPNIESISP